MNRRTTRGRGNTGPFLGPSGMFPTPLHTLTDEIPDEPDELEAERHAQRPEGEPPEGERQAGGIEQLLRRLLRGRAG
jgi:hypothetical protein